jgi:hypothetical protein
MIVWNILLSIFVIICLAISVFLFLQNRKLKKAIIEIVGPRIDSFDKRIINLAKEIAKRT